MRLVQNATVSEELTTDRVYQPANSKNREIIDEIVQDLLLPGSSFENIQALYKLYRLSQEGKSCLILMEHYSNFDIPVLHYTIHKSGADGLKIADSIVPMAGMKLNLDSDFVRAFTESYSRLVIYPSRSLKSLEGTADYEAEAKRSRALNMASLHAMVRMKHEGHIILLFPSGTRYRPGHEDTRKGLPEVDSYLRGFDYVLPIGIAGNILRVNPSGNMADDFVVPDVGVLKAGDIIDSAQFRSQVRSTLPQGGDVKQAAADKVMEVLKELHMEARAIRQPFLPPGHPGDDDGYA